MSDINLATTTATSPTTVTAMTSGQVTLIANAEGVTAQIQITISPAGAVAPGTVIWSNPPEPGFVPLQLAQAVPTRNGPSFYSVQLSVDGSHTVIQALTADGQQIWQTSLPVVNGNSVPDGSGGLIVTEHNTCLPGQTDPMTIVDLDPATGQAKWQLAAAGIQVGISGVVYCYPDTVKAFEPQIAIRGDGAIVVSAMTNNGLPPLSINGNVIPVPASTDTDPFGNQFAEFSPIGPPIVDSDDSVYVEYEIRHITYPPKITSAVLWLLKVAPDNSSTAIQLSSTTNDENLFPGRIVPDGQGGALATWTISPSNGPPPVHPYQAVHVVSGIAGIPYDLPFTPQNVSVGQYPTLVLGENGTAFATDGTNTQIASFDLNSGASNWNYQGSGTLSIIASTDGNGLAAKTSDQNNIDTVIRFDSTGTPLMDAWNGTEIDYYVGDTWVGASPGAAILAYSAAPLSEAAAPGTRPKGNPQHNGTTDPGLVLVAFQDCHKANAEKTLYARYPSYSLRLPNDKSKEPQQHYTVFEHIPENSTHCGVGGFNDINPCTFADGSAKLPFNKFEDEISTGIFGSGMNRRQFFMYGLPTSRLYGVKQIYRTLSNGSLQLKTPWNHLTATPGSDPLIDGQLDPWLAPWDGTVQSCNSAFSLYFP